MTLKLRCLASAAACVAPLASRAEACKCNREPALRDGALVFEGRPSARSETTTEIEGFTVPAWAYNFVVTRVWKGVVGSRISVITPKSAGACGLHYRLGDTYVLSATAIGDVAVAQHCSHVVASGLERTRAIADLGEPKAKFEATVPSALSRWPLALVGFLLGCFATSLLTAAVLRRRRPTRR
jgi:hypothetical protein